MASPGSQFIMTGERKTTPMNRAAKHVLSFFRSTLCDIQVLHRGSSLLIMLSPTLKIDGEEA